MSKRANAFDFAAASGVAAASTAMTLWHRLPMLGVASVATVAERQVETARMVDEKAAAFIEGYVSANIEMVRMFSAAMMGQFAPLCSAPVTLANAGLKPAFRTVNANARRLNRKAVRNTLGG